MGAVILGVLAVDPGDGRDAGATRTWTGGRCRILAAAPLALLARLRSALTEAPVTVVAMR